MRIQQVELQHSAMEQELDEQELNHKEARDALLAEIGQFAPCQEDSSPRVKFSS